MASILIFPFSDADDPFYRYCRSINKNVTLASSTPLEEKQYAQFTIEKLPFIYKETFVSDLTSLINRDNISHIYSPVTSVYAFLKEQIICNTLDVTLIDDSPIDQQQSRYESLFEQAKNAQKSIRVLEPKSQISSNEIAAIFRQSKLIYGESNFEKIQAIIAIFTSAPQGDVIEIGSLMGRTAFVLSYLSKYYRIGSVLAIDPWSNEIAIQKDTPQVFQSTLVNAWDCELLSRAFIINLLSINRANFNYLRLTSAKGFQHWERNRTVTSNDFGETSYCGKIALIHIDGNHDYDMVKQDCQLWLSKLADKAWIILDDYIWAHGDGPKKAGDEILISFSSKIRRSFVCGKALFIQLS